MRSGIILFMLAKPPTWGDPLRGEGEHFGSWEAWIENALPPSSVPFAVTFNGPAGLSALKSGFVKASFRRHQRFPGWLCVCPSTGAGAPDAALSAGGQPAPLCTRPFKNCTQSHSGMDLQLFGNFHNSLTLISSAQILFMTRVSHESVLGFIHGLICCLPPAWKDFQGRV